MDHRVTEYLDARLSLYATPIARPLADAVTGPFARLRAWQRKRQARRDLQALDDRLLADIGLDRAAIDAVVEGLAVTDTDGRTRTSINCATCAA